MKNRKYYKQLIYNFVKKKKLDLQFIFDFNS